VSVEEPAAPAAPAAPAGNTPPAAGAAAPPPRSGTRLEPPAEASPAPGPPPTLETPVSGSAAERQIRAELARAAERLREVTYASLTPDLKGQYDIAERFVRQAHEALGARNLVYAATLAEKAAEIANALPRR
jgi:hypothetical protein